MVQVHPSAFVEEGAIIGARTKIWHHAHVRAGAIIGSDCVIGKDVYVDVGARIGDRCKVQNGVSVYQGVTLEDEVFVGPHVAFTNDRWPRAVGDWTLIPTRVCRGASIGANATILCGVTIGHRSMVGAGAVVVDDVPSDHVVCGNPATWVRLIGEVAPSRDEASCETCAWWVRSDEPQATFGRCRLASDAPVNNPLFVTASAPGATAPSGELRTSEDFSCSQFEDTPHA